METTPSVKLRNTSFRSGNEPQRDVSSMSQLTLDTNTDENYQDHYSLDFHLLLDTLVLLKQSKHTHKSIYSLMIVSFEATVAMVT